MEDVLVFGPCGNVGTVLVDMLLSAEDAPKSVKLSYHKTEPSPAVSSHAAVSVVQADLLNYDSVLAALTPCPPRVVFMTPTGPSSNPMVVNFVRAVKAASPPPSLVVYVSEGDIDDFLATKLRNYTNAMESYALMTELPSVRLEPAAFFTNFFKFYKVHEAVLSGVLRTGIEATTPAGWIDVHDIAAAALVALRSPVDDLAGKHFRLVGQRFSMDEFAAAVTKHVAPLVYEQLPEEELAGAFRAAGMEEALVADRVLVFSTYTDCHLPVLGASTDDLEALIGRPPTSLDAFLTRERALFTVKK